MLLYTLQVIHLLVLVYIQDLKWWLRVGRKYDNPFPRLLKHESTRRLCVNIVVQKAIEKQAQHIANSNVFKAKASYHSKSLSNELLAFANLGYSIYITKKLSRLFNLKELP